MSNENTSKKRRTTKTSKMSYQQMVVSGRALQVIARTVAAIQQHQPVSRRQLSELMNIEICSLCNALRTLQDEKRIKIVEVKKCSVSRRKVSFYAIQTWQAQLF